MGGGLWHGLRTENIGVNEYKNIVFRIRRISKDTPFNDLYLLMTCKSACRKQYR